MNLHKGPKNPSRSLLAQHTLHPNPVSKGPGKGWWLWCSFVLAQIHVGIPRSMHCWHCSESYHFVGFEIRITPNYWKTKRPPHYLLTWKIATQIVEQKKAMKIPGMPTLHCFIAVENDVLWRQINKCYSFKGVTFFVPSIVHQGLLAFKQAHSFAYVQRWLNWIPRVISQIYDSWRSTFWHFFKIMKYFYWLSQQMQARFVVLKIFHCN